MAADLRQRIYIYICNFIFKKSHFLLIHCCAVTVHSYQELIFPCELFNFLHSVLIFCLWFSHFYFCTLYLFSTLFTNSFSLFVNFSYLLCLCPHIHLTLLYVQWISFFDQLCFPILLISPHYSSMFLSTVFLFLLYSLFFFNSIFHLFAHIYF